MSLAAAQQNVGRGPRSGWVCSGGEDGKACCFRVAPLVLGTAAVPILCVVSTQVTPWPSSDSCPWPLRWTCRRQGAPRPSVTVGSMAFASLRSPAQDTVQTPEWGPWGGSSGPGLGWVCTWLSLALDIAAPLPHPGRLGLFTLGVTRREVAPCEHEASGGAPGVACGWGCSGAGLCISRAPGWVALAWRCRRQGLGTWLSWASRSLGGSCEGSAATTTDRSC